MGEINIYKLSYVVDNELEEYCVGTEEEVINEHNSWVKNSGIFEPDEMDDKLATTLQDLQKEWQVENIYTFNSAIKKEEQIGGGIIEEELNLKSYKLSIEFEAVDIVEAETFIRNKTIEEWLEHLEEVV